MPAGSETGEERVEARGAGGTAALLHLALQLIRETKASLGNGIPRKTAECRSPGETVVSQAAPGGDFVFCWGQKPG